MGEGPEQHHAVVVVVTLGSEGLPVTVKRIEDVGRHRIARLDFEGQALNAILPEGLALPAGDLRAQFDPGAVSVYVDDWRVAPTDVPEMAQ